MPEFSTLDGFADITESMAAMIKYVANEPSVGLFYVQQHTHSAIPNVTRLRNKVADKSRETGLHAEDSEDSISTVRSMKDCGPPIADEMIRDIKKTLALMSARQQRRGPIHSPRGPRAGSPGVFGRQYSGESGYFSSVLKSAKQKASNFKWGPQLDAVGPTPLRRTSSGGSGSSSTPDVGAEELPLSSRVAEGPRDGERDAGSSSGEDYDEFKADKEAKLEEWLGHGRGGRDLK